MCGLFFAQRLGVDPRRYVIFFSGIQGTVMCRLLNVFFGGGGSTILRAPRVEGFTLRFDILSEISNSGG